jgi:hypothetical protein
VRASMLTSESGEIGIGSEERQRRHLWAGSDSDWRGSWPIVRSARACTRPVESLRCCCTNDRSRLIAGITTSNGSPAAPSKLLSVTGILSDVAYMSKRRCDGGMLTRKTLCTAPKRFKSPCCVGCRMGDPRRGVAVMAICLKGRRRCVQSPFPTQLP